MSGGNAPVRLPEGVRPLTLEDPSVVGRYRLLGRIGVGGMGVVYLGCSSDSAPVAIKTLHPLYADVEDLRRRFVTEARYARRVASGTARVIEDASDRTRPYIVTEFIEGPPLSRVVEEGGPMPAPRLREVAAGIAAALVAIHGAGLVHRDLKPENVLLARGGPCVIDFGIAHEADAARGDTQAGIIMGSPGWIAPERLLGHSAVAASDVFSWGCLVAFAALGRHPYGTGGGAELGERIVNGTPDLGALAGPLRDLVAGALARDPAMRPSAAEIVGGLLEAAGAVRTRPVQAAGAVRTRPVQAEGEIRIGLGVRMRHRIRIGSGIRPEASTARVRVGAAAAWVAVGAAVAAATFAVAGGLETGTGQRPGGGPPTPAVGAEQPSSPRVMRGRPKPGPAARGSSIPAPRRSVSSPKAVARSAPETRRGTDRGGSPTRTPTLIDQPLKALPDPEVSTTTPVPPINTSDGQ